MDWHTCPPGSWNTARGMLSQGDRSGRRFGASYALWPLVAPHLNGQIKAELEIADWESTGCAGIVFRANEQWSMNCAYLYAPDPEEREVLLRVARYSDGDWQKIADSDGRFFLTDSVVNLLLEYRSGQVMFTANSGSQQCRLSCLVTENPFPGRVGVVRFYNGKVTVRSFHASVSPSLPPLRGDGDPAYDAAAMEPAASTITRVAAVAPVAVPAPEQAGPVQVLFLGANPAESTRLALTKEIQTIEQRILDVNAYDSYRVVQKWEVEASRVQGLLLLYKPQIVQFSGHGTRMGDLVFQTADGASAPLSIERLATMFSVLNKYIRCVILNACFSRLQAEAIARHVEVVVGMSNQIRDSDAITFSSAFHQALARGEDVAGSFVLACNAIGIENDTYARATGAARDIVVPGAPTAIAGTEIPQLVVRLGVDASTVRFGKRQGQAGELG